MKKKPHRDPPGTATFPVPVYSGRVLFCLSEKAWGDAYKGLTGLEEKHGNNYGLSTRIADDKQRSVYLVGVFDNGQSTLVHELVHTTFAILSHSGVPITRRNDEAFAYLMDSLYSGCLDAWKNIRRRKRKKPKTATVAVTL